METKKNNKKSKKVLSSESNPKVETGVVPEVESEVVPEVVPRVAPEVVPEVAPEAVTEVVSEDAPNFEPKNCELMQGTRVRPKDIIQEDYDIKNGVMSTGSLGATHGPLVVSPNLNIKEVAVSDPVPIIEQKLPESPESPKELKKIDKVKNILNTIKTNVTNFFTNLFKP